MDPQATLKRLQAAIETRDYAEAVAALNDYYQWRVKGGAATVGADAQADYLANRLADALEDVQ